jgi:uncharacterized protein (TIGR03000 family)
MSRSSWKCWVFAATLLALTAMAASPAEAWRGRGYRGGAYGYGYGYGHGYSYGYGHGYGYGCCGSYYSSCCTYSSYYTPCCHSGGWYAGCGHRRACCATSCCSYGWHGVSYGSTDCCEGHGGTIGAVEAKAEPTLAPRRPTDLAPPPAPPTVPAPTGQAEPDEARSETNLNLSVPKAAIPQPGAAPGVPVPTSVPDVQAEPASPAPAAAAPAGPTSGRVSVREGSALLVISVPAQAQVIVNGLQTKSTGPRRQFASTGLRPGLSYKYEIRVQVVRDGRLLEDTRTVYLTSGVHKAVAFSPVAKPETAIAAL